MKSRSTQHDHCNPAGCLPTNPAITRIPRALACGLHLPEQCLRPTSSRIQSSRWCAAHGRAPACLRPPSSRAMFALTHNPLRPCGTLAFRVSWSHASSLGNAFASAEANSWPPDRSQRRLKFRAVGRDEVCHQVSDLLPSSFYAQTHRQVLFQCVSYAYHRQRYRCHSSQTCLRCRTIR